MIKHLIIYFIKKNEYLQYSAVLAITDSTEESQGKKYIELGLGSLHQRH